MSTTAFEVQTMRWRWLCAMFWLGLAGCAHSSAGPRGHADFSLQDAKLFEDGIDLIEDPEQLDGQWRNAWESDLDQRIAQSDVIVVGTVGTLRAEVDLDRRTSYNLVLSVERTIEGSVGGSELSLVSREGSAGYSGIKERGDELLNKKFVAFVRYAAGPDDRAVGHFHLNLPSKPVLQRIEQVSTSRRPVEVQVIEHQQ